MDNSSPIVVGLDIGTTKICAIVGRKNQYGKLDILGMGKSDSTGVMRGVVSNIGRTVESIQQAISIAAAKSNVDIKEVQVGIAGQHIKSLSHRGVIVRPKADEEITTADLARLEDDIHKLVMSPGEEILHIIPQEYIVDNNHGIKDPIGNFGTRLEGNYHVITGMNTAVQNIHRCVQKAGLIVADMVLEPIASSEAVLSDEAKEAGVVLVDIGGGTTDVAIFYDGVLRHTAVIPLGGNVITEDIKEGCSVMRKQADLLKINFGSAIAQLAKENEIISIPGRGREAKEISSRNLAHIIQARLEEIFEHVDYEIRGSGLKSKLNDGIVITGGGSQLPHMIQLVEYVTTMNARLGYPNEHLAKGMIEEVRSPIYSTGIGLILHGLKNYNLEDINNDPIQRGTSVRGKSKNWIADILGKSKRWIDSDMSDFGK